ncbi:MAG: hypothetical protein HY900_15270 [Deltaproteobacteria bacterium]|nr:hypothetical protein [Deltaproteobacteria bacterium]
MKPTIALLWACLAAAPAFGAEMPPAIRVEALPAPAADAAQTGQTGQTSPTGPTTPAGPAGLTGQTAQTPGLPLPVWKKVEKPYTNDKCLEKCHGLPGFAAGDRTGIQRSLHVDPKAYAASMHGRKGLLCIDCHQDGDPNFHPRVGYRKVDCRACHSKTPPADVFPANALQTLQARGIKPPPEESRNGESWMKTAHAKAWVKGTRGAPFCSDCHTAHYVRPKKESASTVHVTNLPQTCGACHPDQIRAYGVGGLLARFRIAGHGKGDLSNRYAVSECLSCHQGEAAHGEPTVTKQACPKCHQVPPKEKRAGVALASIHVKPKAEDQPVSQAFGWAYALVFWGAVAGVAVFALFMGFSTLYRTDREDGERKG